MKRAVKAQRGRILEPRVKTSQYVATSAAAAGVAFLVAGLMSELWTTIALHLPF